MKSKIVKIEALPDGNWNGKVLLKDSVVFENFDSGTLTTFPDGTRPALGDELEYTLEDTKWGKEVKLPRVGGGGGGGFKAKAWTSKQVAHQDSVKITCSFIEAVKLSVDDYSMFFSACKDFMASSIDAQDLPI